QADGVDVPGGDTQAHGGSFSARRPPGKRTKRRPGTGATRAFQWSLMPRPGGDRFRHGFLARERRAGGVVTLAPQALTKSSDVRLTACPFETVTTCLCRRSSGGDL